MTIKTEQRKSIEQCTKEYLSQAFEFNLSEAMIGHGYGDTSPMQTLAIDEHIEALAKIAQAIYNQNK